MRQLVDDGHLGTPFENRVEVHLFDDHALILDPLARHHFEPLDQRRGIEPVMRLDKPSTTSTPRFFRA